MPRFCIAVLAALLAHCTASAGPINWSYLSYGASQDGYGFDYSSLAFSTEEGEVQQIYPANGAWAPWMVSPIPLNGPTLWSRTEIIDGATGEAFSFRIPVEFYDDEPAPAGEWDTHVPRIGTITPFDLRLGNHKYHVAQGPWLTLNVSVTTTPEPGTLALAGLGLGAAGLLRLRRRFASAGGAV